MDPSTYRIILVIGAPASGKGSLCSKLASDYHLSHLSVGDMLRSANFSPATDKDIIDRMQRGELLPIEKLAPIIKSRIAEELGKGVMRVLIDGFPRTQQQAAPIEAMLGIPVLVLFFNCPEQVACDRFLTRLLPGRETDDKQMFDKRYREFVKLNEDVVSEYRARKLLVEVDTSGQIEDSYRNLIHELGMRHEWHTFLHF